jgi:GT2 family glycosyltransferase
MTGEKTISVIVLNWNGKEYLEESLPALEAQTFDDFEVIVVDNGSSDGSSDYVEMEHPEFELIELEENRGFAGGNNVGLDQARGNYIALLNNDAVPQEDWLESLATAANETEAGFFASKMVMYDDPSTVDSCGDYYSTIGVGGKRGHGKCRKSYMSRESVFSACGGAAMYSRELLDNVGVFDDDFFFAYEDADLGFRARLQGYECMFVPDAVVNHHLSSSTVEDSPTYVYHSQRNLEFVFFKCLPRSFLIRFLPKHIIYNIIAFLYFAWKGRGRAFLQAKLDVILMLPTLLRKRRKIQSDRQVTDTELRSCIENEKLLERVMGKISR